MLFFGVFAYALRTGKHRALAAVLFALACLCHGIVIFFVIVGALVLFVLHLLQSIHGPIRAGAIVKVALTTTVVGGLLSAFWVIPFVLLHRFGTDMFYERNSNYADMLFPQAAGFDWLLTGVAAIGLLGAVLRRSLSGLFLGIMTVLFGAWAVVMPQSLLWNNRLLPFMYLTRYMLAAVGIVEIGRAIARLISPEQPLARLEPAPRHARAWRRSACGSPSVSTSGCCPSVASSTRVAGRCTPGPKPLRS